MPVRFLFYDIKIEGQELCAPDFFINYVHGRRLRLPFFSALSGFFFLLRCQEPFPDNLFCRSGSVALKSEDFKIEKPDKYRYPNCVTIRRIETHPKGWATPAALQGFGAYFDKLSMTILYCQNL
ncbi:MAG: hypothetical protein DWP97_06860 [Calditrichaeota bacterium]|nr:MAG: hypothetical protein DWP97_06860 [Calditrichota bacterium]